MADTPGLYNKQERRRIAELIVGDDEPEFITRAELIESIAAGLHPDAETMTIEELWAEFDKLADLPCPVSHAPKL